nr:protein of unknown function [Ralstonia solanacearum]
MNLRAQGPSSPREPLAVWAQACELQPETVEALRALRDQEGSGPFMSLLAKLDACESFKKEPHRADSVQELGAVLKLAAHNDAYRAFCFDVAGGADANCYDNAEVIFGNLRLAARDPTYHGNASLEQVLNYHKRCVPWSLVDDFVSKRFPLFAESLENVLALRIRLSDILPIRTHAMTFDDMTSVNQGVEAQARAYIARHCDSEAKLQRNLCRSRAWRQFMERQHCQYAAVGVRAAGCHGAAAGGRCDGGAAGGEHGVLRLPHRSAGQGARDAGHRDGPRVPALAAKRHRAAVGRPDAQARRGKAAAENRGQGVRTPAARSRLAELPGAGASRRSGVLVRWHRHARPARTVDAAHATGNRRRARRIAGAHRCSIGHRCAGVTPRGPAIRCAFHGTPGSRKTQPGQARGRHLRHGCVAGRAQAVRGEGQHGPNCPRRTLRRPPMRACSATAASALRLNTMLRSGHSAGRGGIGWCPFRRIRSCRRWAVLGMPWSFRGEPEGPGSTRLSGRGRGMRARSRVGCQPGFPAAPSRIGTGTYGRRRISPWCRG